MSEWFQSKKMQISQSPTRKGLEQSLINVIRIHLHIFMYVFHDRVCMLHVERRYLTFLNKYRDTSEIYKYPICKDCVSRSCCFKKKSIFFTWTRRSISDFLVERFDQANSFSIRLEIRLEIRVIWMSFFSPWNLVTSTMRYNLLFCF